MTEESVPNTSNIHNCIDEDLGKTLFKLFGEGHDEVEIRHPVDGPVVVTKKEYFAHLEHMEKIKNMSPADTLVERRRIKNIKKQMQMKLRKAMVTAPVHTVDFESNEFGVDVDGNKLDIQDTIFIRASDYPAGIELLPNEVGAFYSEKELKQPIRITGIISGDEG